MSELELSDSNQKPTIVMPEVQSPQITGILKEVEMMMLQKGNQPSASFELGTLTETQRTEIIGIMAKHEDHAAKVVLSRDENRKEIRLREIDASIVTQRTDRYVYIGSLAAFTAITLLILFFKESFITQWLTFITGIVGGFGLGKMSKDNKTMQKSEKSENED